MRNIFIFLCIGSLFGCQTQEFAYRMSIRDSLYRDDSLLAINVLQQLNAREKGDSVITDSSSSTQANMPISLFTLTKELRYPKVEVTSDSAAETETISDSIPVKKEVIKEKATAKTTAAATKTQTTAKPQIPPQLTSPKPSTPAPAPVVVKTPTNPAPAAPKPVEAAKPAEPVKVSTPPASPVKQ